MMQKIIKITGSLLLIDILIKLLVKNNMLVNESIKIINNFFYITYVKNTGAAWSILSGKQTFLIIFSIIVIALLVFYLVKKKSYLNLEVIGYSLLLSGALGNLIDRILYGYVIDYFSFYIFSYSFPIFNFADSCIVIGIVLLFISSWRDSNVIQSRK